MKMIVDPRSDPNKPTIHFVMDPVLPAPGGMGVTTLCNQRLVVFEVQDRDIDEAVRRSMCLPCARAFYK